MRLHSQQAAPLLCLPPPQCHDLRLPLLSISWADSRDVAIRSSFNRASYCSRCGEPAYDPKSGGERDSWSCIYLSGNSDGTKSVSYHQLRHNRRGPWHKFRYGDGDILWYTDYSWH